MTLTDTACRAAKPADRPWKTADGGGLYLLIQPNGSKLWRMNYRFAGKQKTLAFGAYPEVGLRAARQRRDAAKATLAAGADPAVPPALAPGTATFEAVAREWHGAKSSDWVPKYREVILSRLEADVFPEIGPLAIAQIEAPTILTMLRKVEGRGVQETTKRLRQFIGAVFRYAIATGRATRDPAADLRGALKSPPRTQHMAKVRESELSGFLRKLRAYDGDAKTGLAVELVLRTMVRTGEMRFAKWSEIEGDRWRIPADRMKMGREHMVPLTQQALSILDRLRALSEGAEWIAPGIRGRPMSENTMLYAIYRMGYHQRATVHGLRGTASTILNESGLWSPDAIEMQLAHAPANKVRSAYNAAQYWPERVRMMAWWSDRIDRDSDLDDILG